MTDAPGINRSALSQLRPGDPMSALQSAFGKHWRPIQRRAEGFVSGRDAGADFSARVDAVGILGSVSFYGRFPEEFKVEGIHLGMSLAAALQARPGLQNTHAEERPGWAEYREILRGAVMLTVRFKSDHIAGFDLELPGRTYPRADVWTPAPEGFYPASVGNPGEPFADPNLKLVILDGLLTKQVLTLGEPEELAMHVLGRYIDLEEEGHDFLTEAYDYLTRFPLTAVHLDAVEHLSFDGGNDIYRYAFYHWDGESDEFTVRSLVGLEHCRNLLEFNETSMLEDPDLSPLASLLNLQTLSLAPGARTNAHVLCDLPKLRSVTCFKNSFEEPGILDRLRANGVAVTVH
jgi:hypothetical protein